MRYAEILFQQKVGDQKSTLTYQIPEKGDFEIGQIVKVPLRKQTKSGIIWEIHNNKPPFKTVSIKELIQQKPLLNQNHIKLVNWVSHYYFCPLHQTIKAFIPKRIFEGNPVRAPKTKDEQINRSETKTLSDKQKEVIREIESSKTNTFLVHGITGSGKTEIYVRLAEKHITKHQQVLILVPEISLTPQTIAYFENAIGIKATSIHSKLSEGEKNQAWKMIASGDAKLIIGSRSAIFSPFADLGLIVIDEEHESSYKQDSSPRYSIHRVVEEIQKINPKTKVVFGSATPSVETYHKLKKHTYHLDSRIGGRALPKVKIVDLRQEFQKKNYSIFSDSLRDRLTQTLTDKKQAILFLNRRGSASSVVCRDCGYTLQCKKCEIPLTYHARTFGSPKLVCHHCGIIEEPPTACPQCKSQNIRFLGIGTQKIEEELQKEFPEAKVLRADKDTTGTKHGFSEIYQKFKTHKADILVGTQMIAKGLDIPNVTLVGVMLADIGLNIPDYRSAEHSFQLLTQVAGRAGRSDHPGQVVIQTYSPENIALQYAKTQNYEQFFDYEIKQRQLLKNPPFAQIGKITYQHISFQKAQTKAEQLESKLWQIARENNFTDSIELNHYPAYLSRLRGKYQMIILIKSFDQNLSIHKILEKLPKEAIIDPNLKIDIDPLSTT